MWKWIVGSVAFVMLLGVAARLSGSPPERAQASKAGITDQVLVRELRWRDGGFGSVMMIEAVDIVNRNDHAIKDFVVACAMIAPSGTVVGTVKHKVYERVAARSTETFRNINMGFMNSQAKRASCSVVAAAAAK
jgi:hypothetical protein